MDWFSYLGSLITDSRCTREIKQRIAMSRETFSTLKKILCNPKITVPTGLRVLECYMLLILKYGYETWTVYKEMEKRMSAAEMWFLLRILRICWTSHSTNEEVLFLADTEQKLVKSIKKHQLQFLDHCMRKDGMDKTIFTGRIAGKRQKRDKRSHFSKELQNGVGCQGLSLFSARETGMNGINWSLMS